MEMNFANLWSSFMLMLKIFKIRTIVLVLQIMESLSLFFFLFFF